MNVFTGTYHNTSWSTGNLCAQPLFNASREKLRKKAKQLGVRVGRNKKQTIENLLNSAKLVVHVIVD